MVQLMESLMRAVLLPENGGPEVLKLAEVPRPVAGPGQVLVRVEAIGVAYYELAMRAGQFPYPGGLPAVFGHEAAGEVVETGDGVDKALLGERVAVMSITGGAYAEYIATPVDSITPIPAEVSTVDA